MPVVLLIYMLLIDVFGHQGLVAEYCYNFNVTFLLCNTK